MTPPSAVQSCSNRPTVLLPGHCWPGNCALTACEQVRHHSIHWYSGGGVCLCVCVCGGGGSPK